MSGKSDDVDTQKVISDAGAPAETEQDKSQQQALGEYSAELTDEHKDMHIKIYSPYRDYYDGRAFGLTALNDTGTFDVLPGHHNFISLLNACDMVVRTVHTGDQKIRISGGIMHVKKDQVTVFLDV